MTETESILLFALKDLRVRFIGIFDGYIRPTYREGSNPDDDLRLALTDADAAIAKAERQ